MKTYPRTLRLFALLSGCLFFLPNVAERPPDPGNDADLSAAAYRILDSKCNSCHRKRNPLLIFRPKNMDRRANRIYCAVFVSKRMPKVGGEPLTPADSFLTLAPASAPNDDKHKEARPQDAMRGTKSEDAKSPDSPKKYGISFPNDAPLPQLHLCPVINN